MQYVILFLEGIITFISPCLLPLLPVYISFFAGGGTANADGSAIAGSDPEDNTKKTLRNALGFILGFTLVFIALGAFAGLAGGLLRSHQLIVNIITGAVVVVFGLNYLGVLKIRFLNNPGSRETKPVTGFFSATLFGIVFSISWTPCVGAFLGSALMLASQQGSAGRGIVMLLCYSLGLGVPFLISAVLIERLKTAFDVIKKHYRIINLVAGLLLVVMGILMMTGLMGRVLSLLAL